VAARPSGRVLWWGRWCDAEAGVLSLDGGGGVLS
jgi:hypothetical protein